MSEKSLNKKVYLSVTNDLVAEQRVHKVALTLIKCGFKPVLVGIRFNNSKKHNNNLYETKQLRILFKRTFLFYAEYNFRLFFYLIFKKVSFLVANDLDTLLANYLVSKVKNLKLVYDSHEYYTEVPELNDRKLVKNIWLFIEKLILPKIKYSYTVCNSISDIYNQKYNINMKVVRNMPICDKREFEFRKYDIDNFVKGRKIILYQGAVNVGRGINYVIDSMKFINDAVLVIIGDGQVKSELEQSVKMNNLEDKVLFLGKIPFEDLIYYTKQADVGIILCQNISKSYEFSLPNRIFDFIQFGVPILSSDLPERRKIFEQANIGILTNNFEPENLAKEIKKLLFDKDFTLRIKEKMKILSKKYCWEIEEKKLIEIFKSIMP
ncbi:MAG: glycosyltransferase [Bacteroidales bacterium]|nr:glycosyltransferase [Bacteroidales bacterium]MBN2757312.1 glycosyltransferase [Bacteroidales bacterium]